MEKKGLSIASLVLGIIGMAGWLLPIVGFPVILTGLALGIVGREKGGRGMANAGIVLCIVTLVLVSGNAAIGAYKGAHGLFPFPSQGMDMDHKKFGDTSENTFSLRDGNGHVLMEGGIASARAVIVEEENGAEGYMVEITFTASAAGEFEEITRAHIGEHIGIYLNDDQIANPMITSAVTGGACQITGGASTYQEAFDLAEKLEMTIE